MTIDRSLCTLKSWSLQLSGSQTVVREDLQGDTPVNLPSVVLHK